MYETWYKMTALIQSGLDITSVITTGFPSPSSMSFPSHAFGAVAVILDWKGAPGCG